jgi:hypothetical protein
VIIPVPQSIHLGLAIISSRTLRLLGEVDDAGFALPNVPLAEFLVVSMIEESTISSETFRELCDTTTLAVSRFIIAKWTALRIASYDGRQDVAAQGRQTGCLITSFTSMS